MIRMAGRYFAYIRTEMCLEPKGVLELLVDTTSRSMIPLWKGF